MKKIFALLIFILISSAQAQLMVSEKIYQQMRERESKPALMKSRSLDSDESFIYSIAGKRNFESAKKFKVEKLGDFHRFVPNNKNKNKKRRAKWSDDEMRSQAMADIKSFLPKDVTDSCVISSVNYVFQKRDENDPRIVGSLVMAHRVLDGIPIRGSSYVLLNYDSTGNVSFADVEWDIYNKVPAKSTVDVAKRNEIHRADFNQLVESLSEELLENERKGSLYNSVQTLSEIQSANGESLLVPSVTFIGRYSTKNSDESIPMTFDIPTDASLVPVNKALVSK